MIVYDNFETDDTIYLRRAGICRTGTALAWAQPHQYVCRRRELLSAFGAVRPADGKSACYATGNCRRRGDHNGGTGDGLADQSGLSGMGLSESAAEFSGAYLPAVFPCLDTGKSGRNVFISQAQLTVVFALWL